MSDGERCSGEDHCVIRKGFPNKGPSEQRPEGDGGQATQHLGGNTSPKKKECVQQISIPAQTTIPPNFLSAQMVPQFFQLLGTGTELGSFPSLTSPILSIWWSCALYLLNINLHSTLEKQAIIINLDGCRSLQTGLPIIFYAPSPQI